MPRRAHQILLAGLGMGPRDNTTLATVRLLKQARIVYSLSVHTPWLRSFCRNVVELNDAYFTQEEDEVVYRRIVKLILEEAEASPVVALVDDGHPLFFDDVCGGIVARGRRRGLGVLVLPALTSLDVMTADFGIPIDSAGLQMFEANTLVGARQKINPTMATIVFQLGWFGSAYIARVTRHKRKRFAPLQRHLLRYYPEDHRVRVLRVGLSRREPSQGFGTRLDRLASCHARVPVDSTLYIPPLDVGEELWDEAFLNGYHSPDRLGEIAEVE